VPPERRARGAHQALNKAVLLVERFDRTPGTQERRGLVSALTMLGLNELAARHASYATWRSHQGKLHGSRCEPAELFSRITFNILVGTPTTTPETTQPSGRHLLTITPAYDICPQVRNTGRATQAMIIGTPPITSRRAGRRVRRASPHLHLSKKDARGIVDHQIDVIRTGWADGCEQPAHADRT